MGTELTTQTDTRAEMLHMMRPAREHLGSDMLKKHLSLISFELEVVSTKIDRFGWGQMSKDMKDRLTADWVDILGDFRLAEVREACSALMGSKPKDATNECMVKVQILASRAIELQSLQPEPEPKPDPNYNRATYEQKEAIMQDVGFRPDQTEGKENET